MLDKIKQVFPPANRADPQFVTSCQWQADALSLFSIAPVPSPRLPFAVSPTRMESKLFVVVVVLPDAFTEQAVRERAAFFEPSNLRVFFCYFHSVLPGFAQCCWNLLSTSH